MPQVPGADHDGHAGHGGAEDSRQLGHRGGPGPTTAATSTTAAVLERAEHGRADHRSRANDRGADRGGRPER